MTDVTWSAEGSLWTVVIRLRSESKGSSAVRGKIWLSSAVFSPACSAATSNAPSVGSPKKL